MRPARATVILPAAETIPVAGSNTSMVSSGFSRSAPPAMRTFPLGRTAAACWLRSDSSPCGKAWKVRLAGIKTSSVLVGTPPISPPAIRMRPSGRGDAVALARFIIMEPTGTQAPVAGS